MCDDVRADAYVWVRGRTDKHGRSGCRTGVKGKASGAASLFGFRERKSSVNDLGVSQV